MAILQYWNDTVQNERKYPNVALKLVAMATCYVKPEK